MNRFLLVTLLLSNFFTLIPISAFAEPVSYVNPQAFGDCISIKINNNGGKPFLDKHVEKAKDFRQQAIDTSKYIQDTATHLNFITKNIFYSSAFASLPFIDFTLPSLAPLMREFALESSLFATYQQNNTIRPVDRTDLVEIISQAQNAASAFDARQYVYKNDIYIASQQTAASIANPLVTWLLKQPKNSVSHWALLEYATQIYGNDVLTALGVIGELFWQDTLQAGSDRISNAVLSSKMKPLVSPATSNPVGDNYHFWQIVTAAYYEGGTTLGRIYSKIDSKDPGHILANSLGLDVVDRSLSQIGNKNIVCLLH